MVSIGVHPGLASRPHMLGRIARENNLQPVRGNHLHLVSADVRNPIAVTPKPRKAVVRSNYDWTPGGNAA